MQQSVNGVGGWFGIHRNLPYRFSVDVRGSFGADWYENPSTFLMPDEKVQDRQDLIGTAAVRIDRPISERVTATVRWLFYSSDSNTRIFDYDRHIAGALVTFALGN